jgi:hypothetical protein
MEGRPKGFSGADRDPEIETSDIGSLDDKDQGAYGEADEERSSESED